jgi:hypothetical protein
VDVSCGVWDLKLCYLVAHYQHFGEEYIACISRVHFKPKDRGDTLLQDNGNHLEHYMASQRRTLPLTVTLLFAAFNKVLQQGQSTCGQDV